MKTHISSGAVIFKPKLKKILLLYRVKTKSYHLPKGTEESGETLEQTCEREIREETGLEIKIIKYLGKLPSQWVKEGKIINKITHYYLVKAINGKIKVNIEHDHIVWTNIKKAIIKLKKTRSFQIFHKEKIWWENEAEILKKLNEKN